MSDLIIPESSRERFIRLRKERERAQYLRLHAAIAEQRRNTVLSTGQRVFNVIYMCAAILGCGFGLYFFLVGLVWPLVRAFGV